MFAATTSIGCDTGTPGLNDESRGIDAPAPQLVSVTATSSYTEEGAQSVPLAEGSITESIATSTSLKLNFDRFLLPHRVIRQSVCLRPIADDVSSINDCRAPFQPFAEPEYNPVDRSVTYRLPTDARLEADTLYRLTVFAPPSDADSGIYAFDGTALDKSAIYDFRTRPAADPSLNEPLPGPDRYCQAVACYDSCIENGSDCSNACTGSDAEKEACAIVCCTKACGIEGIEPSKRFGAMLGSCAFGECHAPASSVSPNDAMGLNLLDAAGLKQTAINQVAHQSQQGPGATNPTEAPLRFGRNMPLIDPGNPGNSYLLYKLIINPLNHPHTGTDVAPSLAAELDRLAGHAIMGLPMPVAISGLPQGLVAFGPDAAQTAADSHTAMQTISAWIAHGALTECPPSP